MDTTHGKLTVKIADSHIDITNGRAMVRLVSRDGGYSEEYYAIDKQGHMQLILSSLHKNMIASSDHRACSSPMISGNYAHLYAICRESLRMVYSSAEIISHDEEKVVALLTGSAMGHNLTCRIELRDTERSVHIHVEDSMDRSIRPPLVEYLMSSYAFMPAKWAVTVGNDIDYSFSPILRPGDDQIVGDCSFYSPAIAVQHSHFAAALIPDLETLKKNRHMSAALDLDSANGLLCAPLLSYGFCDYERIDGHCIHDMTMAKRLDPPYLKYDYELLIDADCPKKSFHKRLARRLWVQYGSPKSGSAEASPSRGINDDMVCALQEPDAWAAFGVYSLKDSGLKRGAKAVIRALIDAPKFDGLFPTKFDRNKHTWAGCNTLVKNAYYHSVECSRQSYWMLQWYMHVEDNTLILDFCREYADYLVGHMSRNGSIASWFDRQAKPLQLLDSDAQSSATALFLARLGSVTGIDKYTLAAEKAIKFVIKNAVYQDHTLIDTQKQLTIQIRDPHTGALPLSGWALLWTAMACIELYMSTGNRKLIEQGSSIHDHLCLLQSIGDSFGTESIPFGMIARGNVDISPDIELTAQFAWCSMRYAEVTGISEYFTRGSAALKAAIASYCNPIISAHVAAVHETIERSYGSAFVHVGKKWALPVNGTIIKHCSFERGAISLSIAGEDSGSKRIVFGGMRSKAYKLQVNGQLITANSASMKSGLAINEIGIR